MLNKWSFRGSWDGSNFAAGPFRVGTGCEASFHWPMASFSPFSFFLKKIFQKKPPNNLFRLFHLVCRIWANCSRVGSAFNVWIFLVMFKVQLWRRQGRSHGRPVRVGPRGPVTRSRNGRALGQSTARSKRSLAAPVSASVLISLVL